MYMHFLQNIQNGVSGIFVRFLVPFNSDIFSGFLRKLLRDTKVAAIYFV